LAGVFFYLSLAQAGREGEKRVKKGWLGINHLTSPIPIRAVTWYQQIMPNGQRRAGTA
jgi:hypothetical protein